MNKIDEKEFNQIFPFMSFVSQHDPLNSSHFMGQLIFGILPKKQESDMIDTVQHGTTNYTEILILDNKGPGNANHVYQVRAVEPNEDPYLPSVFADIKFQKGLVKEVGVNGLHNEDLIAIVIDRLEGFQSGEFKCKENANAIDLLTAALYRLGDRTADRKERGVEGTSEK